MLRIILLLSPIFVTLFWALTLSGNNKNNSTPRRFLGYFMLFPLIIYISHFFYFAPLPDFYPYFDVLLQYASLLVFPIYFIYFRLLTVDKVFSLRAHARYLTIPTILFVIYGGAVLLTPSIEYRAWLFDDKAFASSNNIKLLVIIRSIIRITYLTQVVLSVIGNHLLIRKYAAKAEEFYSDIQDGRYNNANMLNYTIIFMSIAAFVFTALGRDYLMSQNWMLYLGWTVFSVMLYIIGYMGITQKAINPTFDLVVEPDMTVLESGTLNVAQKKLLKKILELFDEKKIYLNSQLNILEIVNLVGANRTYISAIINLEYNQNFCTFVNTYRIKELKKLIIQNPEYPNEVLAEFCGFGSVNSLKRTISSKTGMSITDWKAQFLLK